MGDMQSSMLGPPRSVCENRVIPAQGRAAHNPAGGRNATGELSFFDQQPQQHLLREDQAQLPLRIDNSAEKSGSGNRTGEFTGVHASWIEADGRINGAFSGVAPDGAGCIGEVAVQFSGATCVPLCGVEN